MSETVSQPPHPTAEKRTIQQVILPGQTPEGEHILGILVKGTYTLVPEGRCVRAEADEKLIPGDVHYDDPMNSSVRFEADFIPFKIATDVVLNGKVYAPRGTPTQSLTASLMVGEVRKDVLAIGDRVCQYRRNRAPVFSDPKPFVSLDILYERAYGGVDVYSDPHLSYPSPRNHLGRGFVVGTGKKALDDLPLPNFEDPHDRLTPERLCTGDYMEWERQPFPQGFGWFSKYWRPRSAFAGVMPADRPLEQELREAYATAVPPEQRELYEQTELPDMDFRFFSGASRGLTLPFLAGNEQIHTVNLSPEGTLSFQLPGERPRIELDIGEGMREYPVFLHTVMIRMEDRQVDLVWRAAAPYPGPDWLPEMKTLEVRIQ